MNHVAISGVIDGDFDYTQNENGLNRVKFTIINREYKPLSGVKETTYIKCIAYGGVADYINSEMYSGASVVVTGRLVHRRYFSNNTYFDKMYVNCHTLTRLEQEEYS